MRQCITTVALLLTWNGLADGQQGLRRTKSTKKRKIPVKMNSSAQFRIIGGNDAPAGRYPFFVQWHGCGASLIHEDMILTAAHCDPIELNDVVVGTHLRHDDIVPAGAHKRMIVGRRLHPSYNETSLENDFMIMKLDSPVPISPVQLNQDALSPAAGETLTVMGFGLEDESGFEGSDMLKEVNINAFSFEQCDAKYGSEVAEENMFCAGTSEGGRDSCQGDSGGPIIDDFGVLVGIVSWGYGCGHADFPGVYARVSGADDWIHEQICDLSDLKPLSCGDGDPTQAPTSPPEGSLPVQISLFFDNYPEETSLELLQDSEILHRHDEDAFAGMESFSETLHLFPGHYEMKLMDSFRDGMCCKYGNGSYAVSVTFSNGNVFPIAAGDAVFNDTLVIDLSVPDDPNEPKHESTPAPNLSPTVAPVNEGDLLTDQNEMIGDTDSGTEGDSPAGECVDNLTTTFPIDSVVGNADCTFLSANLERYSYLCQFLKVAYECPSTCSACAYFQR